MYWANAGGARTREPTSAKSGWRRLFDPLMFGALLYWLRATEPEFQAAGSSSRS
jgi:hypothetical protein